MEIVTTIIKYGSIFFGIYVQIFLLFTYLGWGSKKNNKDEIVELNVNGYIPNVAVIVPCFNEESGVVRTIDSLLASDYPKQFLEIIVVNDGSTDKTWEILKKYNNFSNIKLYTKQNGGKYTALNYGIETTKADIVGCLDADSTIAHDSIRQSIGYFLRDPDTFAVVPTMTVENPKTFIQLIQKVEFEAMLYMREMFGRLNAIFVAPGPLTLFRREVFQKLGPYRHGYLGEDLEIAIRMQYHGMKITYGSKSRVYTFGMKNFKTLIKQRVRWTYAFLMNIKDYRGMLFNPKFGHLGLLILPFALFAIGITIILFPIAIYQLLYSLFEWVQLINIHAFPHLGSLDLFYVSPNTLTLLGVISVGFGLFATIIGRSMNNQNLLSFDLITIIIYPFVSMWWIIKTTWKIIRSEQITWR